MSKPHLIGLSGYAGVGKSTVGQILADEYGYEQFAFADKLRELAYEINPIVEPSSGYGEDALSWRYHIDTYGYERAKAEEPGIRSFLVALGAGARKVLGADVWVDALLPPSLTFIRWAVITDVRYANEALRIKQLGGQVWHIERPHIGPANEEEARSIALLPRADRYIANTGGLDFLRDEVKRALEK